MKEQFFKDQLKGYIHNSLDLQDYEAFFDEMAKVDPVQLQRWIAEQLEQSKEQAPPMPDLSNIHKKVLTTIYTIDPPQTNRVRKISYWTWASCAAIVLCVLSVLYTFHFSINKEPQDNPSTLSWYENPHSYSISTLLPDSSTVILYPSAKISFEMSKIGNRDIRQIAGKVIYKVHKNPTSPFQVNYKGYVTTALGTVFSIDPKSNVNVLIKLLEGKVSVGPQAGPKESLVYLDPNEEVLIDLNLHQMVKSSAQELIKTSLARADKKLTELIPDLMAQIEWTSQRVSFNQTKNSQLLQVIEGLYDVSIVCENPELLNNSFTGDLSRKETLETFFTNFCQLNGCTFRLDRGVVHLSTSTRKEEPK